MAARRDFDYADPMIACVGAWVIVSFDRRPDPARERRSCSSGICASSTARGAVAPRRSSRCYAVAVHPPRACPRALNGFALWNVLVLVLMLVAYGYPIAQFFIVKPPPGESCIASTGG